LNVVGELKKDDRQINVTQEVVNMEIK